MFRIIQHTLCLVYYIVGVTYYILHITYYESSAPGMVLSHSSDSSDSVQPAARGRPRPFLGYRCLTLLLSSLAKNRLTFGHTYIHMYMYIYIYVSKYKERFTHCMLYDMCIYVHASHEVSGY